MPQHSGNYLMRSMEDSQQKIETIVYRAGTKGGPSFESDETIDEGNFYLSVNWSCIILSSSTYQISWEWSNFDREEIKNQSIFSSSLFHL